jgi:hypothetical protein
VVPEAVFGAVIFPNRILKSPMVQQMGPMLGLGPMMLQAKEQLGFDPLDVEQVMVIVSLPSQPGGEPGVGMVVRLSKAYEADKVLPKLTEKAAEGTIDGKAYRQAKTASDPSVYMPDDRTVLLGHDPMLRGMVANRTAPTAGRLSGVFGRCDDSNDALAILLVEPLRPILKAQIEKNPPPPPMADAAKLPELIDTLGLKANVSRPGGLVLSARCPDEAAATEAERIINDLLAMAKENMTREMAAKPAGAGPGGAMVQQMQQQMLRAVDAFRPVRKGSRLEVVQELPPGVGMAVAMAIPAIQAAREAARRAQSMNNMKQLVLGMLNHESAKKAFPAQANLGADGKPLLSWRVHILPFLEQEALHKEFHLDEPWDSDHNKKLVERMPAVFRNPSSGAPPNTTTYLMPVGPGTIGEAKEGVAIAKITDGTSWTVLLVEANDDRAVPWTKPDDWQYTPDQPFAGLGGAHPGGFSAALCDGSVRFIAAGIDPIIWKALLTIAGGEAVKLPGPN